MKFMVEISITSSPNIILLPFPLSDFFSEKRKENNLNNAEYLSAFFLLVEAQTLEGSAAYTTPGAIEE